MKSLQPSWISKCAYLYNHRFGRINLSSDKEVLPAFICQHSGVCLNLNLPNSLDKCLVTYPMAKYHELIIYRLIWSRHAGLSSYCHCMISSGSAGRNRFSTRDPKQLQNTKLNGNEVTARVTEVFTVWALWNIFVRFILVRLQNLQNRVHPESQYWFRSGRSTVDLICHSVNKIRKYSIVNCLHWSQKNIYSG